jgi:diguanylate cyclase (GGDEF)-like protein
MSKRAVVVLGLLGALSVAVAFLPTTTTPSLGDAASIAVHASALVLAALGVRRCRPTLPQASGVVVVLVATGLAASVAVSVRPGDLEVARWSVVAVQVVALALVPFVVRTLRRGEGPPRGTWPDLFLTACGGGLVVVQVLGMLRETGFGDEPAVLIGTAADIVLVVVLLRILSTRTGMAPATVLVLLAAGGLLAIAALVTARGDLLGQARVLPSLECLAMLLLATAARHPSMRHFGTPYAGGTLRRDGPRLLTVVPVFLAVPVLWLLGTVHVLPDVAIEVVAPSGYVLACAGVALAALAVRRAERSADRDPLTDLVNRRGLPTAAHELQLRLRGEDLHLCLVDLDDFKQINDTRGHAVGDALLVEVSRRLRRAVGANGVVSRTGGDEFIVVCWTAPDDEGPADLVLTALDAPFEFDGLPYQVSASIGIAPLPAGVTLEVTLIDADIAMYAAKQAGKGRAQVYRPELRERVLGGLVMQQELRRLLLHNGSPEDVGELVVVHQPIVDLGEESSVRIVGVEALVRWQHPRAGLLTPDEFLHHAEAAGLGARLDEHVATQAVRHLAHWDSLGVPELHLAVNLGVGSLHRNGLARWMTALAAKHQIRPDRIHLEITEHEELPDDPRIAASLREAVSAGFRLDLDDFGIGYTSLSYMRRFPISTVKLDRSLTTLVTSGDTSLLEGIAALCRAMDLRILAEGVERGEQLGPLLALGVHRAQGHWFGTAMSADDVPGFVRRLHARDGQGWQETDDVLI